MAIPEDLFEAHYFDYDDDSYLESDEEDELNCTPLLNPSVLALRLIRDHLSEDVIRWEGTIFSGLLFRFMLLDLHIEGGGYACRLTPRFTVSSKKLEPETQLMLETELKRVDKEDAEAQRYSRRPLDSFHFAALVLRLVETVSSCTSTDQPRYDLDLDDISDTARHFLGHTPKQICDEILSDYRIVHVESIIRGDLARRFSERQYQLRSKLMHRPLNELVRSVPPEHRRTRGNAEDQRKDLVEYLVTPKVTFHGTRPELIPSIVQYGFLKPGSVHPETGITLPVRCGSTYGRGIYSSPSSAFALAYSGAQCQATKPAGIPGLKLLVCATIMARHITIHRGDNWRDQSVPYPGFDSHIANDGNEYIVFDNAQILPCYVVHLDWANSAEASNFIANKLKSASSNKRPWLDTNAISCPGDVQRLRAERLAQARKFFAYGFGPVSGSKIVIEDIADVDDDEEDYGEYQTDRLDDVRKVDIWNTLEGETEKDEYSSQRKAFNRYSPKRKADDEEFSD